MIEPKQELINCANVSKQFGYFFAIKNVSFKVKKNTIIGLAGANGAGKTTLIKILSGLLKPSRVGETIGQIIVEGLNYEHHSNLIKKKIGISTDESFLYEELTIFENLKFYDNLHQNFDKNSIKTKIKQFAKKFNLTEWINEPVENLSHGMKQKVELIRVFMHQPSILFLDEPFSGLDYNTTKLLINSLQELRDKENVSIIVTTHKTEILTQICDEIIILKKGKINKSFTKEEYKGIQIESYF
ncbi:MAG: ABC transporter ATP-binding protein [Promethearchaeota archaeon]|jgi:ABC-type multidrug transport system ATPase subunit